MVKDLFVFLYFTNKAPHENKINIVQKIPDVLVILQCCMGEKISLLAKVKKYTDQ